MSTRLRALGAVVAMVLLTGGCAAGTHPGAAAVVGKTEISVNQVDETSRAVSAALGNNYTSKFALSDLVTNVLAAQIQQQKSIPVSAAETTAAAKSAVGGDEATYQKFQSDSVSRDFLNAVATSVMVTVKLGGGTVQNIQDQTTLQKGTLAMREASKSINVTVAPRFGQWTDGQINSTISGSLSKESDQTKAKREATATPQPGQG